MVTTKNNKIIPNDNTWSYDKENRESFKKEQNEIKLLNVITKETQKYIEEAIEYVKLHYPKNYGTCEFDNFIYPINRTDALDWLNDFVKRKLLNFGKYEDAFSSKIIFGFHSVLSPLTNVGLINPSDIINKVKNYKDNIASKEGFIRQIIGWREYCFYIYTNYYNSLISNFFYKKSNKLIPEKFWLSNTQIPLIDHILTTVNKYAYSHHIERLMCIGNFMLLIDISPKEIYKWFQTMYIDAYDVFMIPNVYGMLLYGFVNEKNHMMTRPYFCSSNYLLKMSNFKSSDIILNEKIFKWNVIVDALYYRLIHNYSEDFSKIYSVANAVKRYSNFTNDKKKELLNLANLYMDWLYT
jgi:deoxyribodipyrimidine photolyase-related protein